MEEFIKKFEIDKNRIYSNQHWTLSLRPLQSTIGSCILSLNRECNNFSDISDDESISLKKIIVVTETSLHKSFSYERINYLMLMMVDSQLHFHVLPRYSKPVIFNGKKWTDTSWPKLPEILGNPIEEYVFNDLLSYIIGNTNGK